MSGSVMSTFVNYLKVVYGKGFRLFSFASRGSSIPTGRKELLPDRTVH